MFSLSCNCVLTVVKYTDMLCYVTASVAVCRVVKKTNLIDIRKRKFVANYILSENVLCKVVANVCSLL